MNWSGRGDPPKTLCERFFSLSLFFLILRADPTPNPTSPFSSKLTYSYSFSPLHTRSCTLCGEEELRAREYPEYRSDRKCSNCFKEVKANRNNFHKQQFLSGKFKASTVYFSDFSVFLCSDCYNDKEFCLGEYLDDELFE